MENKKIKIENHYVSLVDLFIICAVAGDKGDYKTLKMLEKIINKTIEYQKRSKTFDIDCKEALVTQGQYQKIKKFKKNNNF